MLKLVFITLIAIFGMAYSKSFSPFGGEILALSGVTDCGVATVTDIRLTGCTSTPCNINVGGSYDLEIDYSPRDFHFDMHFRAILHRETELVEIADHALENSTVDPAEKYTFRYSLEIPTGLTGRADIRLAAWQNYVHEICLVIPVNIS